MRLYIFCIALLAFTTPAQANSWWVPAFPQNPMAQEFLIGQAANIVKSMNIPANATFHEKADTLRDYVHNHSEFNMDEEFYSYWHDVPKLLNMLRAHDLDPQTNEKPHMECASRSASLYWLYKAAGIRARPIVVYQARDPVGASHTFLEILNPETQQWEIQDPTYSIFWRFHGTQKRADITDLLTHDPDKDFEICKNTNECGLPEAKATLVKYMQASSVIDIDAGKPVILYNPERFSPDHPFLTRPQPLAYCALFDGPCFNDIRETGDTTER